MRTDFKWNSALCYELLKTSLQLIVHLSASISLLDFACIQGSDQGFSRVAHEKWSSQSP